MKHQAGNHVRTLTMTTRSHPNVKNQPISSAEPTRILLLEDNMELSQALEEYLAGEGYEVQRVPNGAEGINALRAKQFHVIVCDMRMPYLPGDMFYRAVQQTCPEVCGRFIFMTGHRADRGIDQFIRRARGFLLWKPFEMRELLQAIQLALRKMEATLAEPVVSVSA
jgi:DNA-binding response OmpR family regulator